eukprot:CCRYP_016511-RA/>CCRYP_016511-RA protein AED:0.28 eAED:0.49 QI:0/0/0/1/1/1/2/0/85
MGKDDSFDECVDFDPPRRTRSMNAMDQAHAPPKWAFGDDFDAPVFASPQSGTTVMTESPIVIIQELWHHHFAREAMELFKGDLNF